MMELMTARAGFIRSVEDRPGEEAIDRGTYPWSMPAVAALADGVALDPGVTYLVGENGSGKSTLIEALAVAAGLNPEGGSRNFAHSTRDSHSELSRALRLIRGERHPKTDFFLRAESFFTAATYLESVEENSAKPFSSYGAPHPTSSPTASPFSPCWSTASAPTACTS